MTDIAAELGEALRDRYRIERELGRGGMAAVFLAHDLKHDRRVALKVLHPEVAATLGPARFLREIRLTARLQHPHILPVFDSGEDSGRLWYTMPYVEGESLRQRLRRNVPLTMDEALQIVREMAEALDCAHSQGIVHRDVKPENILLSRGHAFMADFGIARPLLALGGQETGEHLTETGLVVGSLGYMSPEQVVGDTIGSATDVFSLGVVFYEALTGNHPFEAGSRLGVLSLPLGRAVLPPSRVRPEVPETLDACTVQMLALDPERRPSAAEVAAMLGRDRGERSGPSPGRVYPAAPRPSVGREEERALLRAAFEALGTRGGHLVCITGEPGIGKTTLVEDCLAELSNDPDPPCIARGHCSERLAGSEAYLPFLEALEGLLEGEYRESAARWMKLLAPTWYTQVVPAAGDLAATRPPSEMQAGSQERMKRELGNLLHELSRMHRLVFFLDDIHWADVSTVDLLAYLATRFETTRLLVLVTYRPSELFLTKHPFLEVKLELQGRRLCREAPLEFLTAGDVARFIELEFPAHRFAASFAELIHARTEGNPLFLVDLLRYLRERGVIAREEEGWNLGRSLPELEGELPESVRGMIERKIAQLTEAERRVVATASVQGYRFDSATVTRALALEPAEVEEHLQVLERTHDFVRLIGEQELPDRTLTLRYQFVHVLYQNALYAALTPTRRAQLSAASAQALLAFHGEQSGAIAAELAVLFKAARDLPRAADYLLLAAQNATAVFAYREAVALVRRGLALVEKLPATADRTRRELMFWITLGSLLITTKGGGDPQVEVAYRRAQDSAEAEGASAQLFTALRGLSEFYHTRGPRETGLACAQQALIVAQRLGDPALIVDAHHAVAMPLLYLGELERARQHVEQGIALYDARQRRGYATQFYHAIDPGVGCRYQASRVLWLLGYPDQAHRHAEEGVTLAQQLSHTLSLAWIHAAAAALHQCRSEPRQAQDHAATALALGREHEWPEIVGWGLAWHGWAVALQGALQEGIAELRDGISALAGHTGLRPHLLALLAETLGLAGRLEEALDVVADALAASETGGRYYRAELYRLRGELLVRHVVHGTLLAEAENCFRQALEIARSQQAKSLELRVAVSLCRLPQDEAGRDGARRLLESVYGWFTEGFDTADLQEARQLLPADSPSRRASPPSTTESRG